jgi:hypothetical protein
MDPERRSHTDDPVLAALGELPVHDVEPGRAEAIRRLAHAQLGSASSRGALLRRLERAYTLAIEPAFVCSVVVIYLAWALHTVNAILTRAGG